VEAAVTASIYDALIIGAGPAGATTAHLLAQAGWSVLLLERHVFPRRKVCGEYLSATNLPLFDRLGVGRSFREQAGPPIRKVGLFAGQTVIEADLPRPSRSAADWGRALSRERLDPLLLDRARGAGAEVRQPSHLRSFRRDGGHFECQAQSSASGERARFQARLVIAAHGSWDAGALPTQPPRLPPMADDLLGFKAHFEGSALPADLMPLLAFPGGYGGMVHCEGGRVSLSCCVRRDQLAAARKRRPGDAGAAVLAHVAAHCRGVRWALAGARRQGDWLAAGPLRPGLRHPFREGVFLVGNGAGEAHPVIAEGISIALQSAWLLSRRLIAWKQRGARNRELAQVASAYSADWRRHFAPRLYLSQLVAHWAMRRVTVACSLPLLRSFPAFITWFARLSGKDHTIVAGQSR
jgi:flavin-dependent dehydrogenase